MSQGFSTTCHHKHLSLRNTSIHQPQYWFQHWRGHCWRVDQNSSPVFTQIPIGETLLDPSLTCFTTTTICFRPVTDRYLIFQKLTFFKHRRYRAEGNTRFVELFRINRGEVSSNYDSIILMTLLERDLLTRRNKSIPARITHQSRGMLPGFTNTSCTKYDHRKRDFLF